MIVCILYLFVLHVDLVDLHDSASKSGDLFSSIYRVFRSLVELHTFGHDKTCGQQ